jgi:hypothetical protein
MDVLLIYSCSARQRLRNLLILRGDVDLEVLFQRVQALLGVELKDSAAYKFTKMAGGDPTVSFGT